LIYPSNLANVALRIPALPGSLPLVGTLSLSTRITWGKRNGVALHEAMSSRFCLGPLACISSMGFSKRYAASTVKVHPLTNGKDFDRLSRAFKVWYGVNLEHKEHALRGWNWGKGEFGKAELLFNVQNRPAFEIPYSEIQNTNLAGRNEVAVDFLLPADGEETGTNGHLGGARAKGRKSGGARDQLVEARFYIPGTVLKREKKEGEEDGEVASGEEDGEEQNAANTWYETLVDKAEIGDVAGDTFASFLVILHLTPRSVLVRTREAPSGS